VNAKVRKKYVIKRKKWFFFFEIALNLILLAWNFNFFFGMVFGMNCFLIEAFFAGLETCEVSNA
jgi:hypothetical protein